MGDVHLIYFFVKFNNSNTVSVQLDSETAFELARERTSTGYTEFYLNGKPMSGIYELNENAWHFVCIGTGGSGVTPNDSSVIKVEANGNSLNNIGYLSNTLSTTELVDDLWTAYTKSEALQFVSYQPMEFIQNDIAAYPGISWQQVDTQPE